jgi:dephospho-CoA kinase
VLLLGVTGGIATGKSSFTGAFSEHFETEIFDADRCARALLNDDGGVRREVEDAFGPEIYRPDRTPDRGRLRELVFSDPGKRTALEGILHPRIRAGWLALAKKCSTGNRSLLVDIPLLFETGAETHFDVIVVVACSPATQRRRLQEQRALSTHVAEKIIAAQLDLGTKIRKADHLIWNDSTFPCLNGQAELLARCLRRYTRSSPA